MELVCTTLQVVFPFSVNPIYHVLVSALRPCHRCLSRPVSRLSCGCPQRHIGFPFRFAHGLPSAGTRNDLERHRGRTFSASYEHKRKQTCYYYIYVFVVSPIINSGSITIRVSVSSLRIRCSSMSAARRPSSSWGCTMVVSWEPSTFRFSELS